MVRFGEAPRRHAVAGQPMLPGEGARTSCDWARTRACGEARRQRRRRSTAAALGGRMDVMYSRSAQSDFNALNAPTQLEFSDLPEEPAQNRSHDVSSDWPAPRAWINWIPRVLILHEPICRAWARWEPLGWVGSGSRRPLGAQSGHSGDLQQCGNRRLKTDSGQGERYPRSAPRPDGGITRPPSGLIARDRVAR